MRVPCPYCDGRGRVLSPQTVAVRARRELARLARIAAARIILAHVHPEVADIMAEDAPWTEALERETHKTIVIRPEAGVHLEHVSLLSAETVEAAEREAAAQNGRGRVRLWLEPGRGGVSGGLEDEEEAWQAEPVSRPRARRRGLMGRLRSWWGGRLATWRPAGATAPVPRGAPARIPRAARPARTGDR